MPDLRSLPGVGNAKELAARIEHTRLNPAATPGEIRALCAEATHFGFYGVCVNPINVRVARRFIGRAPMQVVSTVGFPYGASRVETKLLETRLALRDGASEIDLVPNLASIAGRDQRAFEMEIEKIARLCHGDRRTLKVIVEAPLFDDARIAWAAQVAARSGADMLKSSTGLGAPTTVHQVKLLVEAVGGKLPVKAAGGIRNASDALRLIRAGASRIGASRGVAILKSWKEGGNGTGRRPSVRD